MRHDHTAVHSNSGGATAQRARMRVRGCGVLAASSGGSRNSSVCVRRSLTPALPCPTAAAGLFGPPGTSSLTGSQCQWWPEEWQGGTKREGGGKGCQARSRNCPSTTSLPPEKNRDAPNTRPPPRRPTAPSITAAASNIYTTVREQPALCTADHPRQLNLPGTLCRTPHT